jgi:(p)ppGpp synthase/HD superfamily hydrolase
MADAYSRSFDRALVLAALVHERAARKGTVVPYVIHPVHVATLLVRHGYGEALQTAAVLHDVLEDVEYGDGRLQLAIRSAFPRAGLPDRILAPDAYRPQFDRFVADEFGGEVMELVRGVTEEKNDGQASRAWRDRKSHTVEHLRTAPDGVVVLKAGDALHNVRSILEDVEHHGADVLNRFKAAPSDTLWYYRSIAETVSERLGPVPLAGELQRAVGELGRFVATLPA